MADEVLQAVEWESYEHEFSQRGADWFWALGIVAIALCVAALLLGNSLLALLIIIAGAVIALAKAKPPVVVNYAVSTRGVIVDNELFPYSTLESFYLDEEDIRGPHLLVKSQRLLMPLMVIPVPPEHLDDIEELIASKLPEEFMEESILYRLMEFLGF